MLPTAYRLMVNTHLEAGRDLIHIGRPTFTKHGWKPKTPKQDLKNIQTLKFDNMEKLELKKENGVFFLLKEGNGTICPFRLSLPMQRPSSIMGQPPTLEMSQMSCTSQCALFEHHVILHEANNLPTNQAHVKLNCSNAEYVATLPPDTTAEKPLKTANLFLSK